jgi:hypothetical protein
VRGDTLTALPPISLNLAIDVLHEDHLDDDGAKYDDEEEGVIEEADENVDFAALELASIDLVEDLKEHKTVEENGIVDGCCLSEVLVGSDR